MRWKRRPHDARGRGFTRFDAVRTRLKAGKSATETPPCFACHHSACGRKTSGFLLLRDVKTSKTYGMPRALVRITSTSISKRYTRMRSPETAGRSAVGKRMSANKHAQYACAQAVPKPHAPMTQFLCAKQQDMCKRCPFISHVFARSCTGNEKDAERSPSDLRLLRASADLPVDRETLAAYKQIVGVPCLALTMHKSASYCSTWNMRSIVLENTNCHANSVFVLCFFHICANSGGLHG